MPQVSFLRPGILHANKGTAPCPRTEEVSLWFPHEGRVPHISLVSCEMWDTTHVAR